MIFDVIRKDFRNREYSSVSVMVATAIITNLSLIIGCCYKVRLFHLTLIIGIKPFM